ncbi:MAG: hypothetical protein K2O22_05410 [Anaeroplasmataceae bacterium]|nr:hypothetical protein [Anaeroplasmataceae bacterium]
MKQLSKEDLNYIEFQLYNKARDVDVAIYNAIMDPTAKEFVIDSLYLYLTKEGGIGSALEIDNYNPNASVYQTYEALRILSDLGFDKHYNNDLFVQLVNKIGNYLFNRQELIDGLWNPLVPSNDKYAHSEEYNYTANPFPIWGVHPTAAILGYILELMPDTKAYYKKALKQIGFVFSKLDEEKDWNTYAFISYSALLRSLKKTGLFQEECYKIEQRIKLEAMKHLEEEDFNFPLYLMDVEVDQVLQEKIDAYLDRIMDSRASHGLWENKKAWGSNRYPEADSAGLKWIGARSVWNLYLLKAYGRIEE